VACPDTARFGAYTVIMIDRRRLLLALSCLAGPAVAQPRSPVVTVFGDSITAGLGLPAAQAMPAQLQAVLQRRGVAVTVRASGVSGDTTASALARLDFSVRPDTSVCVVALGGNDLLQSISPEETRANLDRIVKRLKARGIKVVLAGSRAPARTSGSYGRDFNAVFPQVAKANAIELAADLLAGIIDQPAMKQSDGLHPNAAGARLIAERLAPFVSRAVDGAKPRRGAAS
jgi:acyl-CoA thioesterase-1